MLIASWRVVVPPAEEPITLADAKEQARVLHSAEDDWFSDVAIPAARQYAEQRQGRALIEQTRELTLDRWPSLYSDGFEDIELPGGPLTSITSVTYTAVDGTATVWDAGNYVADTLRGYGRFYLAYGVSWPAVRTGPNAVRIRYVTGAASANDVNPLTKAAIKMLVALLYKEREGEKFDRSAINDLLDMDSLRRMAV